MDCTDDCTQNFLPKLRDHLLTQLLGLEYNGDEQEFMTAERNHVVICKGSIYQHQVLRVNYTTYDMWRDQDSINVKTHPDIMLIAREDESDENRSAYWYARVIGVFHAYVQHTSPNAHSKETQKMDFLWVQWYIRNWDGSYRAGWKARQLPRVSYIEPQDGLSMFGFLDPNLVVCGVHIIPGFEHDYVEKPVDADLDCYLYYINM